MKAISLWEPWASFVRAGAKTWETRSWPTKYRGKLLICAAKGGLSKRDFIRLWPEVDIKALNFGKAVAVVNLTMCLKTDVLPMNHYAWEENFGDYTPGRYAWKLGMIDNKFEPFPVKGHQGFFNVEWPF